VHDGVRPLVSKELIARCFAAAEEHGAASRGAHQSSVREVTKARAAALDRSAHCVACKRRNASTGLLRKAFELPYDPAFTDEATLVERSA
jgi:2-C-methyl-D-erythritol 4-phosphate cytidylyltransferase